MQFDQLKRRDFIMLAGSATAWPLAARAQRATKPVIGFLHSASREPFAPMVAAFRESLNEAGFVEGRNVIIEYRWAEGRHDQLARLADELVRREVAVIVAAGPPAAYTAKAATSTIPVVFVVGIDPVHSGLVASLNRPEGNLTGVGILINVLAPKQLEVLHEIVPKAMTVAMLVNPDNPNAEVDTKAVREAAQALGLQLIVLEARAESDIDTAFATLVQRGGGGLVLISDPILIDRRDQLVSLAARYAIPTIGRRATFPEAVV
jgi:putative ABC transport system substrate-binding protein